MFKRNLHLLSNLKLLLPLLLFSFISTAQNGTIVHDAMLEPAGK